MGEELRGYLLKGPVRLDEGRIMMAAELAYECLNTARELTNLLAQCEEPDRLVELAELSGIELAAISHVERAHIIEVASELCIEFDRKNISTFVMDFVTWWESTDDKLDPTVHSRLDPDDASQQILFAGATSDEDYVVSYGCKLIQTMNHLGVLHILGIK